MKLDLAILDEQPEIFYTIQGEGKNTGKPSIFIRLAQCNLHCIWCDTAYTWNWKTTDFKHKKEEKFDVTEYSRKYNFDEIIDIIDTFPCTHLVVTGGEPLLQQKKIVDFVYRLKEKTQKTYSLEIETNGTITPIPLLDDLVDQYNVSPKLSNAGMNLEKTLKKNVLQFYAESLKSNFKFVLDTGQDLQEVLDLQEAIGIPFSKIYLMPEGNTPVDLVKKREKIIDICKQYGFMFTDRLHVHVYGTKRGV